LALFRVSFFSACYQRLMRMNVLLPADTPLPPGGVRDWGPYKTLYLLHGFTGNCDNWLHNTMISEMSMQFNIAVVMPDGVNGFYVDQPRSGIRGSEFIGRELIDFTRRTFPLSDRREDTLIGGRARALHAC
jgi:S-formylglutathione hydrolase FrmB